MFLKAEQLWRIATVYDKVAEAEVGVPSPQRSAFARKAKHLRMLARIAAKIEATGFVNRRGLSPAKRVVPTQLWSAKVNQPKVRHKSLAERLETARAAASAEEEASHHRRAP